MNITSEGSRESSLKLAFDDYSTGKIRITRWSEYPKTVNKTVMLFNTIMDNILKKIVLPSLVFLNLRHRNRLKIECRNIERFSFIFLLLIFNIKLMLIRILLGL